MPPKDVARVRRDTNITTVRIDRGQLVKLRKALDHFRIDNLSAFYRSCNQALIEHHKKGHTLVCPLLFRASNEGHN